MTVKLAIGARVRKSSFFDASRKAGLVSASVYNHMYMPTSYGDPAAEYDRLINGVSMWDVAVERQVALKGPDALALAWIAYTARIRLPRADLLENNTELAVLFGLGLCCLAATIGGMSGFSPVFGAFCAGLAVSHTNLRKPILAAAQPLQSLLLVVFFVSIGLLVDVDYVMANAGIVLGVTFALLLIKTLLGWGLLYAAGIPSGRALVSSLMTPQIGEFSFVLVTSGMMSGVFTSVQVDFLFAVIAASLFVSPVWSGALHYLVVRHRIHQPVLLGAEAMPDCSGAKGDKSIDRA